MGLSFHTEHGPFASILPGVRRFVLEALVASDAGWVVRGESCPDCLHAHVTRASVVHAFKTARGYIAQKPKLWAKESVVWTSRGATRDVVSNTLNYVVEELTDVDVPVIVVEDDYKSCLHPRMHKSRTQIVKIKEMAWATR